MLSRTKSFNLFGWLILVSFLLCTVSTTFAGEYVVKEGDTLSGIASLYGLSSHDIRKMNSLSEDYIIVPGEVLYVPTSSGSGSSSGSSYWVTVSASDVNLRQNPSLDSNIICSLKKGESAEILKEQGQWCYIALADGYQGWVSGDFLGGGQSNYSPNSSYTYTPSSYIAESYTCGTNINVRSGPGHNEKVLFGANKNEELYVLDYEGDWIYVAFTDGAEGWVYYDYIDLYHGEPSVEEQKQPAPQPVSETGAGCSGRGGNSSGT